MNQLANSLYIYFGGGLHVAKDNADASRQFREFIDHNGYGASDLNRKDGRLYTNGKMTGHVSYNGRVWDLEGREIEGIGDYGIQTQASYVLANITAAAPGAGMDMQGVITSFTKLLLARLAEGDDVTEQLHALNHLREQQGMKPIAIPEGGIPKREPEKPKSQQRESEPHQGGALMVNGRQVDSQLLPDNKGWTNRFKIKSESSGRLYTIAQNKFKKYWGCDCPSWIARRRCKHLDALGLPGKEQPFEANLKQGSLKKQAGRYRLYTGPTLVKQTAIELRKAGIPVLVEGTENVIFESEDQDSQAVTLRLRDILGPQWGVKGVQRIAADLIHSDTELDKKMQIAPEAMGGAHIDGPEAGPSNDELHANEHLENGVPVTDGNLKPPERQNVNAIREALETQVEMEVGKPIVQKQHEVEMQEQVQDKALAQGAGAIAGEPVTVTGPGPELEAKPGTQIVINIGSKQAAMQKVSYVKHCPGHKNSKGEPAEWCIYSHETGKILSSHGSKGAAEKHLQDMHAHSGSAEPIGGEPEMQDGITSGHAGGMFGGTDLEGPSFHVGFTLKGFHREASFSSLEQADKFIREASAKFGKMAGDWTMKCPKCGGTASKDKPQDSYQCGSCGWNSNTKTSADTDPAHRTLVYTLLQAGPKTTGEIEAALGGGKHTNKAYPILQEMAKDGIVAHKQMRWSLKQAKAKVADGWTNLETETVNLYITGDQASHKAWWDIAKNAVEKGIPVEVVAKRYSEMFANYQDQMEREMSEEYETPQPVEPTNWIEIAQDAMDYVRNEQRAEEINLERREGPAEQRFKKMIEPGDDLHAKGMGISLSSLRKASVRVKVAKVAGENMANTETKEAGFNFFFPGQVLKEFYPEIQHEIVDYPNATNQSISMEAPEMVGDGGHEIDGLVDSALDTTIVEAIELPADVTEPMAMAAADYSSTSPAGGMGIGRDGKPEVLEGAPLRKENDIRGYMFTDEFYGQYEGIPGAAMNVASKTAANGDVKAQFAEFLNFVCGEIAATMVAAFKVTSRPLLDKMPGVGELQLDQIEQGAGSTMPTGQISQGGRVKFLLEQMNDGDIKAAINDAWAQAAVWHDGDNGGFVYEVFVRPETIDTDSLQMKYKFVCGTRQ